MADKPTPRRRFQFRLRTLMIVVTMLAAQCAFVAWVFRDRQRLIRERDDARVATEQAKAAGDRAFIDRQNVMTEIEIFRSRSKAAESASATKP